MTELDTLLHLLVERDGSDLHLRVGEPPVLRVHGGLQRTDLPLLTAEDTKRLVGSILNDDLRARFAQDLELDFSYATQFARFRVNIFRQQGQVGAVLRLIPLAVRTADDLMLPASARDMALRRRGLLLVTGPTGAGKSATVAALIDHINTHRRAHIMTVESPIEFVHSDKMAAVSQREIGQDTHSYAAALQHVARQNPDVVFVDCIQEVETAQLVLAAAETGQLMIAMLSTVDAVQTLERLIDMFPPEQQRQTRAQLAATFVGIISQTLVPRSDETGRVAAFEVLVATPHIRSLIRDGKVGQITTEIQIGGQHGMVGMDHSLAQLYRRGLVKYEDALAKSYNPHDFEQIAGVNRLARR